MDILSRYQHPSGVLLCFAVLGCVANPVSTFGTVPEVTKRRPLSEAPTVAKSERGENGNLRWIADSRYAPPYEVLVELGHQRIGLDLSEVSRDEPMYSSIAAMTRPSHERPVVSASTLALKAKSFNDGLYAAIEVELHEGDARASQPWLASFVQVLSAMGPLSPEELEASGAVAAAALLSGVRPALSPALEKAAQQALDEMNKDPSTVRLPLGFYGWNDHLGRVFRTRSMLQRPLSSQGFSFLSSVIAKHDSLAANRDFLVNVAARLTNPMDQGVAGALLPPSRSFEGDLVRTLIGSRPVPPGFDLAEELVRRVRSGNLVLQPTEHSGWYDYQTYALEPLLLPDRTLEAERLTLSATYKKGLEELFKSLMAADRETHIAQLTKLKMAASRDDTIHLHLPPPLSVEPLATHYFRTAEAYRFVRTQLTSLLGAERLAGLRRLREHGAESMPLDQELRHMETLYRGAYFTTCIELGMECRPLPTDSQSPSEARLAFREWAGHLSEDRDLSVDIRMMVPVFYDVVRKKTKVWVLVGLGQRTLKSWYDVLPAIKRIRRGPDREWDPYDLELKVETGSSSTIPTLFTAEVYVGQVLGRAAFQKHCDQYKTVDEILKHLR